MKHYPSIGRDVIDVPIIAFDKLDGSNIRCEWTRKAGLHKFGSRKVLVGEDHPVLGRAQELTLDKYGDSLGRIFRDAREEFVTCYLEFHGARSFAGLHEADDPTLTVTLIDVDLYKRGLPKPRDFVRMFDGKVETPQVVYEGKPSATFVRAVHEGLLVGVTCEGVVCKGNPLKGNLPPVMFKVKSREWADAVKARYGSDEKKLQELL